MLESIYKNEEILSPEYLPDLLPHRETQVQLIADNIKPASVGRKPQSMFIFGKPGIGKTASTRFVFRNFEEYSGRVKTIYINTWDYNTSNAILTKIVHDLGFFIPRRGVSKNEVMEKLTEALRRTKKSLIVCLDEVDQLIQRDEKALYDLLRMNQYVENPVGLIMISNYKDVLADLDPRIRSSLDVEEIEFKSYTLNEMKSILNERCKHAFRLGAVEEGVILLCANHAVTRGGDVRLGLECLRKAAKISEKENSSKLKVAYVRQIMKDVKQAKLRIMKDNLKEVDKNVLGLLSEKEALSTELHDKYIKQFGQVSQNTFRKHIKYLEDIGMIKIRESRRGTRGRKYFIRLVQRKIFK